MDLHGFEHAVITAVVVAVLTLVDKFVFKRGYYTVSDLWFIVFGSLVGDLFLYLLRT